MLRRSTSTKANSGKKAATISELKRLLSLAKKEKWYLVASVACLVVSSSVTMGVPYAIGKILDVIFAESFSREKLNEFCLILFGIFALGGLGNFGRIYFMNSASKRFDIVMMLDIDDFLRSSSADSSRPSGTSLPTDVKSGFGMV